MIDSVLETESKLNVHHALKKLPERLVYLYEHCPEGGIDLQLHLCLYEWIQYVNMNNKLAKYAVVFGRVLCSKLIKNGYSKRGV